ncbi:AAA family ATPase [Flavobacterium sp.]|uniref:AAA family ATPase n=3 Tax=Flavobacterium sp. TaxID=239 RepID=UPI0040345F0A
MILEFTVGNFLSFKDKKTLSLEAGRIKELKDNVITVDKYKVLRSATIYGANSSGKSNFIKALDFMVTTIKRSSKLNSTDKLNIQPFLLSTETEDQPSFFEILILEDNIRYRYGFELDNDKIHSEWLYVLLEKSKNEDLYFIRTLEGIGVADAFKEASGLEDKTRDNALFLPLTDQFNTEIGKLIMKSISRIHIMSGLEHEEGIVMTNAIYMFKHADYKSDLENFIRKLDLGFNSFDIDSDSSKDFKDRLKTIHKKYDNKGNFISNFEFKMTDHESSGTNKILDLSGYIILALKFGLALVIDELDAKLHPILTQEIIKLFNNPKTNPENAQLIFSTHDTNLLGANLFRRDQVWFTEKDQYEATDLYSLLEFKEDGKTVRNDRSFEADYIKGRYGAIPYLSNFQEI